MRGLLILIVLLAIALLIGDRVAVTMAQREIGRKIAADYQLPRQPRVTIGGFPFLTQAVDGTYRDIDLEVGEWSGDGLSVRDLAIDLTEVSAPLSDVLHNRTSSFVAARANATAVVPYDAVRGFAPPGVESISYSPDGLRVTGTFLVEGIPVPGTVIVTVAPTERGIEVTPVAVQAAAGGPTISLAMLRSALTFTVPLRRLPLGARLTAIAPGPGGLDVTAVADDVRFADLP